MTRLLTIKEVPSTVTSKGQVTIPSDVRKHLGIGNKDKIIFVIEPEGKVQVKPLRSVLNLRGTAGTLPKPLKWKEIKKIVHEDRAETYTKKHN